MRLPRVFRRDAWAFLLVATLAFKSFVPLLAVVAADLQGKQVADVCAVYGVRLPVAAVFATPEQPEEPAEHGHAHAMTHVHDATMVAMDSSDDPSPAHHPDNAEHSRDHCALTGLAFGLAFALTLSGLVDWRVAPVPGPAWDHAVVPWRDASARWLTLRVHAPPQRA